MQSFISAKSLGKEPYSGILGYPRATKRQVTSRIRELEGLGVRAVSFTGPTMIGRVRVLGKGYAGIVILGRKGRKQVAVKARRTDSPRASMAPESKLLKLANTAGVGPKLFGTSRNFMVMEYLEGERIATWAAQLGGAGSAKRLKGMIRSVLCDCHRLDCIGLDHGELSTITKHVIVTGAGPRIIDFEAASTGRRPSNVTSATQAIYIGSGIAKKVAKTYRAPPKGEIIRALRAYKEDMADGSFAALLKVLGV